MVAGLVLLFWVLSASLVVAGLPAAGTALWCAPRTGLMFASGALLWMCRDRVPLTRPLVVLAILAVLLGLLTPNYRLLAAPAIAYLCLAAGLALGRYPRLVLRTDLSYGVYVYGFVVQQALLVCGVDVGWAAFTALSLAVVLPVAAASWFLVEAPLARRRTLEAPKHANGERSGSIIATTVALPLPPEVHRCR